MPRDTFQKEKQQWLVQPLPFTATVAAATALFIGLFPGPVQLAQFVHHHEPDALSIAYLRLLIQTHPDDVSLRRTLANDLALTGKWQEALEVLTPLAAQRGAAGVAARLHALEIAFAQERSGTTPAAARPAIRAAIDARLGKLIDDITDANAFDRVATIGLALNMPLRVARLYQKRARLDPLQRARWLATAGRHFLAAERPARAARAFEGAAAAVGQDNLAFYALIVRGMDAYLAADAGKHALRLAIGAVPRLPANGDLLERIVVIALAQNDAAQAQAIGRRLVALAPDNVPHLRRQVSLEIGAHDHAHALALLPKLIAHDPGNRELRSQLAQIAQDLGQLNMALDHWSVLAREEAAPVAVDRVLRLSYLQRRDDLWFEFAAVATREDPLTAPGLAELYEIQARQPSPEALLRFLQPYVLRHPARRPLWKEFAERYEAQGNLTAAIVMWKRPDARIIKPVAAASRLAMLYVRQEHPARARAALVSVLPLAKPDDRDFWEQLGDMAWTQGDRDDAVDAYAKAWQGGSTSILAAERLIQAHVQRGQHASAVDYGRHAFDRLQDSRWLLLAMDAALQGSLWPTLRSLLDSAAPVQAQLAGSELYWLGKAQADEHERAWGSAQQAYVKALALRPQSVPIRVQILWTDLNADDRPALATHLAQWDADATGDQAFWSVYAIGMQRLGRHDDAVAWLQREAVTRSADPAWLLGAIATASQARMTNTVSLFRADLRIALRTALASTGRLSPSHEKALMLAQAALVLEAEGSAASEEILRGAIARGHNDADVYEQLVASALLRKDYPAAAQWLRRADADQRRLPGYQVLAVALARDDRPAIERIIEERKADLSAEDRISSMRLLGHRTAALALAEQAVLEAEAASLARLRAHRDQLRIEQARRIKAEVEKRNLGEVDITQSTLSGSVPVNDARITVQAMHTELQANRSAVLQPLEKTENDVSLQTEFSLRGNPVTFSVGANQRGDDSLIHGRVHASRALSPQVSATVDVRINAITEETSALRVIGSKHRAAASLGVAFSDTTYARAEIARQWFKTRDDNALGRGYHAEAELGKILLADSRTWRVRLSGSLERNQLAHELPSGGVARAVPAGLPVSSVLAPRFSTLGVGTTFGLATAPAPAQATSVVLDGWIGRQWPESVMAYSSRAVLQIPVMTHGVVNLSVFYTNVQNGLPAQSNRGAALQYEHRF